MSSVRLNSPEKVVKTVAVDLLTERLRLLESNHSARSFRYCVYDIIVRQKNVSFQFLLPTFILRVLLPTYS